MIRSRWRRGSGAPSASLGRNGDLYLRESNGDVYEKDRNEWALLSLNLKGPAGTNGTAGAQGPAGSTGAAGPSNTITTTDPATLTSGAIVDGALFRRSGSNFVGLPMTATAGTVVRMNAAGTGMEGVFHNATVHDGTTITTSPQTLFTLTLPEAGSYLIEGKLTLAVGGVTGTRTTTVTVNVTNLSSMSLGGTAINSQPNAAVRTTLTATGGTFTLGLTAGTSGWLDVFGKVVVSAASTFSLDFVISGETSALRGGSFVKANRYA